MARLPQVGGDKGNWGDILNDYLKQAHAEDGTLATDTVGTSQLADGSVTQTKLVGAGQAGGIGRDSRKHRYPKGSELRRSSRRGLTVAGSRGSLCSR